ncbi:MAG: hypothetical protein RLP14_02585 [Owenweeksia sp.]
MKRIALLITAMVLIMAACESPTKDISLHINPTFYKYVVEIDLEDLSAPGEPFTGNVDVAITGEDEASIYGINGVHHSSGLKPNFGSIQLITTLNNEPTAGDPLRFTVEVSSSNNNYRKERVSFEVHEGEYYVTRSISLLNLYDLPSGVTQTTGNGSISNGVLTSPLVLKTDSTNGVTSKMALTIPSDINFLDAAGNAISSGSLDVSVLSFSDTAQSSQLSLPNNSGALQKIDFNGQTANVLFDPGATFEIDMNVGGTAVKQFSGNGVGVSIPVPAHMYNWDENRAYQAGDKVTLISHTYGDAAWNAEGNPTLVMENGKLVIKANITHLSTYKVLRDLNAGIAQNATITITNNSSKTINTDIFVSVSGSLQGSAGSTFAFPVNIATGESTSSSFSPYGTLSNLVVYSRLTLPEFDLTTSSQNIGITFRDPIVSVLVGYRLYCPSSNAYVVPPAGVKMFYRKSSVGGPFKHLFTFTGEDVSNRFHASPNLEANEFYDLKAYYGTYEVDTAGVKVIDRKIYEVNLPAELCNEIGF